MIETIPGNLYDHPKYYELVFGSDWRAEYDFLRASFAKYATGRVQSVFEPACGTGRLLVKFAQAGLAVAGNDLNPRAVAYCNARLARLGFPPTAVVGDMADFRLMKKVDAAFNMINSFRHLPTHDSALAHLQCVANALRKGGLYLLGLHLTPTACEPMQEEDWAARRGNLAVLSRMWTTKLDLRRRQETVGMRFDVYTPTRVFRLTDTIHFRTYTRRQMEELLRAMPSFKVIATHDFAYDIKKPIKVDGSTEDVVYVLRKE